MSQEWWVYILECGDGSLYTGITVDVTQRLATHNQGQGSRYTRSHLPVKVVFTERQTEHSAALKREHQIKKLTRAQKKVLLKKSPTL